MARQGQRVRNGMGRRRFLPRTLTVCGLLIAVAWIAGFVWFVRLTRTPADPLPAHADGIVALTGGTGRVELALRLIAEERADRLLITGIGGGTELATFGRMAGVDTAPLAPRITLGRYAASTRGNGVETAAWAEQNRIRTLIVVTAGYHMPRALAELHQAMPDVHLLPMPVQPGPAWMREAGREAGPGLRLEASEYVKYLLTITGLAEWLPHREPASLAAIGARA